MVTSSGARGLRIARAEGARLYDAAGHAWLDLCTGFGTAFLGHGNAAVTRALAAQLAENASPGFLATDTGSRLDDALARWLPPGHALAAVYSGGTEAVETALRIAAAHTGRAVFAGFAGAHHGRSLLARALAGPVSGPIGGDVVSLPHPPAAADDEVLAAVRRCLETRRPAALVVEPVHMSSGAFALEDDTMRAIADDCRAADCLLVYDELLTGACRSGARFLCAEQGVTPDLLVAGKALAGGFPAAVLSVAAGIDPRHPSVGYRSTYTDHPLAAAAITAALSELERLDAARRAAALGEVIASALPGTSLRGRGAMWCVDFGDAEHAAGAFERLLEDGIVTSFSGRYMRLLPPLVVDDDELRRACRAVAAMLGEAA